MPGTDQEVQNDAATADPVAPPEDIDLDRAAADAERRLEGNTPVETPTEEPTPPPVEEPAPEPETKEAAQESAPEALQEEPEDHKERTKLGRKVANLEGTIGKLLEQNAVLIERLTAQPAPQPQPEAEVEQEYIDLATPEGLRQFLAQERERERVTAHNDKAQYAGGYASQVKEWNTKAEESEDADATEIHKLLTGDTPFNVRHSGDPKADFTFNLSRAEAHYYKQKAKAPAPERKAPLQNATPRAPLSVGGESKADASGGSPKPLSISPAAMEFAKAQGWSDDDVRAALATPVQNSFVKGRR